PSRYSVSMLRMLGSSSTISTWVAAGEVMRMAPGISLACHHQRADFWRFIVTMLALPARQRSAIQMGRAARTLVTVVAGAGPAFCLALLALLTPAAPANAAQEGSGPIAPLRPPPAEDAARVSLGEALFRDPRLSGRETAACVSCHDLDAGGDDGRERPIGA